MSLSIRPIMNSSIEDIFAFKTCCGLRVFDQNLEIHITNHTHHPIYIPSHFDLKDASGWHRIDTLIPHGEQCVLPDETIAFYCAMDEQRWKEAQKIIFYDREGHNYAVAVNPKGAKTT
jgi:hypothetical protein